MTLNEDAGGLFEPKAGDTFNISIDKDGNTAICCYGPIGIKIDPDGNVFPTVGGPSDDSFDDEPFDGEEGGSNRTLLNNSTNKRQQTKTICLLI